MEELYFNNNQKAGHETNLYGVEILHSSNLHYKIIEKAADRFSQKFCAD